MIKKVKVFIMSGITLTCCALLFACHDDSTDVYVSYGVIKNAVSAQSYQVLTDKGNTLVIKQSNTSQTIEEDKRVLVNFEILSDKDKSKSIYEVKVNGFYSLLSKPVVRESFILEDEQARRDSIGNDAFNSISAWFGGDFINVNFEIYHSANSDLKHFINLIYDDTRSSASDTLYLTLRHNAYGEIPGGNHNLYKGLGRCSFRLADLLPEGLTSAPVKLTWSEYGHDYQVAEHSDTGVFKTGSTSQEEGNESKGFDTNIDVR